VLAASRIRSPQKTKTITKQPQRLSSKIRKASSATSIVLMIDRRGVCGKLWILICPASEWIRDFIWKKISIDYTAGVWPTRIAIRKKRIPAQFLFQGSEKWSDITFKLREMNFFRRNNHSRSSQKNGDFSRRKQ
jgi:hypothetical protein